MALIKRTFSPSFAGFPEELGEECRLRRRYRAANRRFVPVEGLPAYEDGYVARPGVDPALGPTDPTTAIRQLFRLYRNVGHPFVMVFDRATEDGRVALLYALAQAVPHGLWNRLEPETRGGVLRNASRRDEVGRAAYAVYAALMAATKQAPTTARHGRLQQTAAA